MKNYILFILPLFLLSSCTKKEKDFLNIPSIPIHGTALEEEIISSEGGVMSLIDSCFFICRPNFKDAFLVLDEATGKEITKLGSIGEGPGEFTLPVMTGGSSNGDTLYIANRPNKVHLYVRKRKGDYQYWKQKPYI